MDTLPLHPKIIHLPIALAVLLPMVSAAVLLAWVRDLLPRRAWALAVALQAMLLVSSLAAMRTGEADEEVVERVVAESAIEAHEEAAETFTWAAGGALVLFVAAGLLPGLAGKGLAAAAVASTLVVTFLGYRVGQAGGALVYERGAASAWTAAKGAGASAGMSAPDGAATPGPRSPAPAQEEEAGHEDDD